MSYITEHKSMNRRMMSLETFLTEIHDNVHMLRCGTGRNLGLAAQSAKIQCECMQGGSTYEQWKQHCAWARSPGSRMPLPTYLREHNWDECFKELGEEAHGSAATAEQWLLKGAQQPHLLMYAGMADAAAKKKRAAEAKQGPAKKAKR